VNHFSTPRARNAFATHVPILIGLGRSRKIQRVLEFGCGKYSTLTFLNRSVFPHLEQLHSVENDDSWAAMIQEAAKHDSRWSLQLVSGEIADSVTDLDLEAFDLIMIDDSQTSTQRAATIRTVASRKPQHPWIVIHDFEVEDYRKAAAGFKYRHRFRSYNPETGLVGNQMAEWKGIDGIIRSKKRLFEPDAIEKWTRVFGQDLQDLT
jgi:hypothetical protein